MKLGQLRSLIAECIAEHAASTDTRFDVHTEPYAAARSDREQLGSLAQLDVDVDETTGLASHLVEPVIDREDTLGPVPPTESDPYVQVDPFATEWSPFTTTIVR